MNKAIQLYDADSGRDVRKIDIDWRVNNLRFTPDSKCVLTTLPSGPVGFCHVDSGKPLRQVGQPKEFFGPARRRANGPNPAVSADGKFVLAPFHNTVRMWNFHTGEELPLSGGQRTAVAEVHVTRDGKHAVTDSDDRVIRTWDLATGRELNRMSMPFFSYCMAVAPDGRTLAVAPGSGVEIRLIDALTGKELAQLKRPDNDTLLAALLYSPDGKTLASLNRPTTAIVLRDAATGAVQREIPLPVPPPVNGRRGPGQSGGSPTDLSLVFGPDSKTLIGHFADNTRPLWYNEKGTPIEEPRANSTLRIWDTATGKLLRTVTLPPPLGTGSIALATDGRVLACENDDGTVSLWELASGKERRRVGKAGSAKSAARSGAGFGRAPFATTRGMQARTAAHTVAFAPDGRLVAFNGPAHSLRIWDADAGTEIGALTGQDGDITTLAFTRDGRRLVTGSSDTTLLVWDLSRLRRPAPSVVANLSAKEQSELWHDLLADDAGKAFRAIRRLAASPGQAVPLLRERIKPAPPVDPHQIQRLIGKLGSDDFDERNAATEDLTRLGDLAVPALHKVAATLPSLEARRRVEALLLRLTAGPLMPEKLRAVRAVEVLERAATPEARQALQALAKGAPAALVTREAQAALDRLR